MKKFSAGLLLIFVAALCGCGGSDSPPLAAVSGTASQGAPITEGALVTLKDSTGTKVTSTVKANGLYSVVVDGMTAPYVVNAGGFYSFASAPGTTNINPFTNLSMQLALGTSSITDSTVLPANFQAKFTATATDLKSKIDALYPASVTATQKDFLGGNITIAAGVDKVFDSLAITAPDASGNFSVSIGGQQIISGGSSNGVVTITPDATAIASVKTTITSAGSTAFTVGTPGTFTVTGTGTFSVTGTLPSGVSFDAATGVLNGTPATGSNASYPLVFTAANNGFTVTQAFTLTVSPAPVVTPGGFTAAMISGKTFDYADTAGNAGTLTFHANGTFLSAADSGTWSINASGQLVGLDTSGGKTTFTLTANTGVITASALFIDVDATQQTYTATFAVSKGFDGHYAKSTLFADGFTHVGSYDISGTAVSGTNVFSKTGALGGTFTVTGTVSLETGFVSGQVVSSISGNKTFNGSVVINSDKSADLFWVSTDNAIGGSGHRLPL